MDLGIRDAKRLWAVAVLLLASAGLLSCGRGEQDSGFEVDELYGEGTPVEFRVMVSRRQISTADELSLVLQTRAAENWSVSFPEVPDNLGGFTVTGRGTEGRRLERDRTLVSTRAYTLEPFLPGEYTIPSLEAAFGERDGTYPFALVSEEITVQVVSVLPPQLGEQDIGEIAGPLTIPRPPAAWIGLAAAALVFGSAAVLLIRRRRGRVTADGRPRPPWEEALEELDALLARDLAGQQRYDELYTALSDLARRYIERRFGVRAPEQTTEEFLATVRDTGTLAGYRPLLQDFLSHCDLVKFARYRPNGEEVRETVAACRRFLTETVPGTAQPGGGDRGKEGSP
ncbi:MAG: hypothetical protein ACOC8N_06500 [Spirochaetota bacterium]